MLDGRQHGLSVLDVLRLPDFLGKIGVEYRPPWQGVPASYETLRTFVYSTRISLLIVVRAKSLMQKLAFSSPKNAFAKS